MHQDVLVFSRPATHVGKLTLNQPTQRNSLSQQMLTQLQQQLHHVAACGDIHVLIIAATAPVFCAGHNLKEVLHDADDYAASLALFQQCASVMQAIQALPMPVLAEVSGMATAAGCQLVAACDLAVASASARFATPGVNIGLFCSTPMVALSRAVGRKQALAMLFDGEPLDAPTALAAGLINRVVPDEQLPTATLQWAQTLAAKAPQVMALGKAAFYRQLTMPLADAYAYTSQVMAGNLQRADAREGIAAFMAKRAPQWQPRTTD